MGTLAQLAGAALPAAAPACVCRLHAVAVRPAALVSDESALEACSRWCAIQIDDLSLLSEIMIIKLAVEVEADLAFDESASLNVDILQLLTAVKQPPQPETTFDDIKKMKISTQKTVFVSFAWELLEPAIKLAYSPVGRMVH